VAGVCDVCQSTEFVRRKDDSADTVRERLLVYYRETSPLIGYYFAKGKLHTVDGMGPVEDVAGAIAAIIDAVR
jgi:adenylate kinase